jgi:hypothetical protein
MNGCGNKRKKASYRMRRNSLRQTADASGRFAGKG